MLTLFCRTHTLAHYTGLCIEPNPIYWLGLATYRSCQVVAAVVGKRERVSFSLGDGSNGGIVDNKFDNKSQKNKQQGATTFFTVPLVEILERNNAPAIIDYLSLDVEGAEFFVLEDFPFDNPYLIRIMTIERPTAPLRYLLEEKGFVFLKLLSIFGETLWVHKSQLPVLDVSSLERFKLPNQDKNTFVYGGKKWW